MRHRQPGKRERERGPRMADGPAQRNFSEREDKEEKQ